MYFAAARASTWLGEEMGHNVKHYCLTLLGPAAAKRQPSGAPATFVGLQPTVIASRASPPLLEQSSRFKDSKNRGRASPVNRHVRQNTLPITIPHTRKQHGPSHAASSILPYHLCERSEPVVSLWLRNVSPLLSTV